MIPGVRESITRDITINQGAVPPKTLEPFVSEGNHGTNMTPQEHCHTIATKWTRQTSNKRDTAGKTGTDPQYQVTRKQRSSSSDHFGSPSQNVGKMRKSKGEPSRAKRGPTRQQVREKLADPKGVQIGHSQEASKRKYPRCRNTYLVKLKTPGQKLAAPKVG